MRPILGFAAAVAIAACSSKTDATAQTPLVPAGFVAESIGGQVLYLRPGFTIGIFASVGSPRFLALGPGNVVYVARTSDGVVAKLPDANHDGVADTAITVASGLNGPFGIAFRGDTMFVAEENRVRRYNPGAAPVTIIDNIPTGGHSTRTLVIGPDSLLYLAVGSSCNICNDAPPRAAVTRFNLDGSGAHTFATGLRNSVGLAFNPSTGELWANNNDRDNLGDDVPPEHLNILKDGKWYGWPQCYLPNLANPEYSGADCSGVEPPALTVQAHSAPLGLAFYTGTTFPADYHGDAFMTFHGSWNRSVPTGAKVVRVHVANGRPTGVEDFVVGWQLYNGDRWGRPVSLLVLPDGSLLISDDAGDRIWRVTYAK